MTRLLANASAQALSQWIVDRAVQPIENSLGGSIHAVYDLLIRYRVHIIAETSLKVGLSAAAVCLATFRKAQVTAALLFLRVHALETMA